MTATVARQIHRILEALDSIARGDSGSVEDVLLLRVGTGDIADVVAIVDGEGGAGRGVGDGEDSSDGAEAETIVEFGGGADQNLERGGEVCGEAAHFFEIG